EILKNKDFNGTILLAFQPAEESSPLNHYNVPGGAAPMILEGAIGDPNNPEIDAAIALHINARTPTGTIVIKPGPAMGSSDIINIKIKGKGGHGSAPHMAIDPILIASNVYIGIQAFLSRRIAPVEPKVFTIGKIVSGTRQNIIPEMAEMEGTFRTLNTEVRELMTEEIPKLIKTIASSYGGSADVEITKGYPVGVNDEGLTKLIQDTVVETLGSDSLIVPDPILGAEDFFEFGLGGKIPAAMFFLGARNEEKGFTAANHSNYFDIDEDALKYGTTILVASALNYLK
ncbi:MAG: M20 metallopeptidase family protein, partial [Candidatus Kariarchaeaceae archaeon]